LSVEGVRPGRPEVEVEHLDRTVHGHRTEVEGSDGDVAVGADSSGGSRDPRSAFSDAIYVTRSERH